MRVTPHGKLLPQQDQIGDEPLLATLQVPGSGRIRQMIAAAERWYGIRLTASVTFTLCGLHFDGDDPPDGIIAV